MKHNFYSVYLLNVYHKSLLKLFRIKSLNPKINAKNIFSEKGIIVNLQPLKGF